MKNYIYYAFSFSVEDNRYTVLLNNECYDSDRNLTNIAARKIDTMISEFLPANETQITTDESVDSDSFISYLCERYQISISQHLCTNFENNTKISIFKEKEKPLQEDLDVLPEDQC
jgi:hypothetical protein